MAFTVVVMFLIGAPLGAIIKKGGLGMPVLVSILFFVVFYVVSMLCQKWASQSLIDPEMAAWIPNAVLMPVGMFFLVQAKRDARLFEADFYNIVLSDIGRFLNKNKS